MSPKILFINSEKNIDHIVPLIRELKNQDIEFTFLIADQETCKYCDEYNWPKKKIRQLPKLSNLFFRSILIILYPYYLTAGFIQLYNLKKKDHIDTIVCFAWPEKLVYTLLGKLFKLKVIWLEYPGTDYKLKWILRFYLGLFSRWAHVVSFNALTLDNIQKAKIKTKTMQMIPYGFQLSQFQHQENIFEQLADANQKNVSKKFYTIGTVIDLNNKENLETVFLAIKKCQNVIPNIQLIIIGDGKERKNLKWLTQKMGIDTIAWFVGEQKNLTKWLENFDLYLVSDNLATLNGISAVLHASMAKLPLLSPISIGYDDIVINNDNGIMFTLDNSEDLSQAIIKLYQNTALYRRYSANAYNHACQNNKAENVTRQFLDIINKN